MDAGQVSVVYQWKEGRDLVEVVMRARLQASRGKEDDDDG
jgi:hypothetical protein